jgi:hypothetical protein
MSSQSFEHTLARLYTDSLFREGFLRDADAALNTIELTDAERAALRDIDRAGLMLAAASFAWKRAQRAVIRRSL